MTVALLVAGGCASTPEGASPETQQAVAEANDPWEGTNRSIFAFNQTVDDGFVRPVAEGYRWAVPDPLRDNIHNVLGNMGEPVNFINAVFQGNGGRAAETLVRFLFNSTAGMAGLFDVAGSYGLPMNDEDFGQTLAVWGVPEGPYLMLPVFGPSSIRGTVGKVVDSFSNPISYFLPFAANLGRSVTSGIDIRERNIETLDDIERNSLDYYAALRSLYRQNRDDQVNNGELSGPVIDIPVYAD